MKTIVCNESGHSKYVFEDSDVLDIQPSRIVTPNFVILDYNDSNCTLYEGVTPPGDWSGCKYFFDGTDWTLDPDWVDPQA